MPAYKEHIIDGTELLTLKRWKNTCQDVLVSLDDLNTSGAIHNFANANLTLTGNRTHDTNNKALGITNGGSFASEYFYMAGGTIQIAYGSSGGSFLARTTGAQIYEGGVARVFVTSGETIFNDTAQNHDFRVEGQTDANLFFADASTDRVGIGTNTPQRPFHVAGESEFEYTINIVDQQTSLIQDTELSGLDWFTSDSSFASSGINRTARIFCYSDSSVGQGFGLKFSTAPDDTDATVKMTIEKGGDVGIGTTTPAYKLDVNGDGRFNSGVIINDGANNSDTRIEGQTDANLFFVDASTDRVGIGTNTPAGKLDLTGDFNSAASGIKAISINATAGTGTEHYLSTSGGNGQGLNLFTGGTRTFSSTSAGFAFNPDAASLDVSIEGQTDANLFFTDASTDRVGIGTNVPSGKLHIDSSSSAITRYTRTSTTTNVGFEIGGSSLEEFGLYDYTNSFYRWNSSKTEMVINESAANYNFRVEGQTDANLFFVDASTDRVGIGTNTPSYKLHSYSASNSIYSESSGAQDTRLGVKNTVRDWSVRNNTTGVFQIQDETAGVTRFYAHTNGDLVLGSKIALATTATGGFTYIPTCAGTPTGTPTAYTGKVPMVYDTTNSIMYIYTGGSWAAV